MSSLALSRQCLRAQPIPIPGWTQHEEDLPSWEDIVDDSVRFEYADFLYECISILNLRSKVNAEDLKIF